MTTAPHPPRAEPTLRSHGAPQGADGGPLHRPGSRRPGADRPGGLVHQRRAGRAAAGARLRGLLPGEPRRPAGRLADGRRDHGPGPRRRLLPRHLLLPHQRHRRLPGRQDAALALRALRARPGPTSCSTAPTSAARCATGSSSTAASGTSRWSGSPPSARSARCGPRRSTAVTRQLEGLIPALEAVAGRRLDGAALEEAVERSRTCSDLWRDCLDASAARPAPLLLLRRHHPDGAGGGPARHRRGLRLLPAPQGRAAGAGRGRPGRAAARALPALLGRHADLGHGCATWPRSSPSSRPASSPRRTATAGSSRRSIRATRSAPWPAPRWSSSSPAPRGPSSATSSGWRAQFQVDGLVFHDCAHLPQQLQRPLRPAAAAAAPASAIPVLVLDGDLNDLRCFSDEQARTNLEAFVEQLADAGGAGAVGRA